MCLSWKLRFPGDHREAARAVSATRTKRSFADKGVPKLELGHEGWGDVAA